MIVISDNEKRNYLHTLEYLVKEHAKIFTLNELSELLGVSKRTIQSFKNGEVFNYWLLSQYAGLISLNLNFTLCDINNEPLIF